MKRRSLLVGLVGFCATLGWTQNGYRAQRIDSINNGDAVAEGINDNEVTVGHWKNSATKVFAFVYTRQAVFGSTFRSFPPPAGRSSTFRCITNTNVASGWAHDSTENKRPAYVTNVTGANNPWIVLGTGSYPGGSIYDCDGGERLVGEVIDASGLSHPAIWTSNLPGANPAYTSTRVGAYRSMSGAFSRRAVGYRKDAGGVNDEAMWTDTNGSPINNQLFPRSGYTEARAFGINDFNLVVGQVKTAAGVWLPCQWTWNGPSNIYNGPYILPTPTNGSTNSEFASAVAVSNGHPSLSGLGVIVGSADDGSGTKVACRWQYLFPYGFENLSTTSNSYSTGSRVFSEALAINDRTNDSWSGLGIGETIVGRGRPVPGGLAFEAIFCEDIVDEDAPPITAVPPHQDFASNLGGQRTIGSVQRSVGSAYDGSDFAVNPGFTPNQSLVGQLTFSEAGSMNLGGILPVMEDQTVRFKTYPEWAAIYAPVVPSTIALPSPGGPDNVLGTLRTPPVTLDLAQAWQIAGATFIISVEYPETASRILQVNVWPNATTLVPVAAPDARILGTVALKAKLVRTAANAGLGGRSITFAVTFPSGATSTESATTDGNGVATARVGIPRNAGQGWAHVVLTYAGTASGVIPAYNPANNNAMKFKVGPPYTRNSPAP